MSKVYNGARFGLGEEDKYAHDESYILVLRRLKPGTAPVSWYLTIENQNGSISQHMVGYLSELPKLDPVLITGIVQNEDAETWIINVAGVDEDGI
jgi:hypothetical protein